MKETILIVDDDASTLEYLTRITEEWECQVLGARTLREAIALLESAQPDLMLLDLELPDGTAGDMLRSMSELYPVPLVLLMSGTEGQEATAEAMNLGAYDCLRKPFDPGTLRVVLHLALETQRLRHKVDLLKQGRGPVREFIGDSAATIELRRQILRVAADADATVLITGESGTGKELAARGIHSHSSRREGPFIDINCASLPSHLLESELFGFERGAFTDARARKPGYFELAEGGTLFLDEIAEMEPALQAKLLRVLEQRTVRHLGGTKNIPVNVRVIAATNQDIRALVDRRQFREDLYYRLNVIPIRLVPLRERAEDIPPLLERYRSVLNARLSRNSRGISPEAQEAFQRYAWPGNVRELMNILERILILHNPDIIELAHLPQEILARPSSGADTGLTQPTLPTDGLSLPSFLASTETELIRLAMERASNNVSEAARLLQVPRETLRYKLGRAVPGAEK